MSLDEGSNVNLEDTAADVKQYQRAVPRNQSAYQEIQAVPRNQSAYQEIQAVPGNQTFMRVQYAADGYR